MTRLHCPCGDELFEVWIDETQNTGADARPARLACKSCGHQWTSVLRTAPLADVEAGRHENPFEIVNLDEPSRRRLDALLTDLERRAICFTLAQASGNRSHAARTLGISRSRLYRRMEALGIAAEGMASTPAHVERTNALTGELAPYVSV
jgi:DNA-binding NtrC family response regulator